MLLLPLSIRSYLSIKCLNRNLMTMHSGHEYGPVTIVALWNKMIFELAFQWFIGRLLGAYREIIGSLSVVCCESIGS